MVVTQQGNLTGLCSGGRLCGWKEFSEKPLGMRGGENGSPQSTPKEQLYTEPSSGVDGSHRLEDFCYVMWGLKSKLEMNGC